MARRAATLLVPVRGMSGLPFFGPDTLEGLFEKFLAPKSSKKRQDEDLVAERARLTSTRREAIELYRDIFRASRAFVWPNEDGILWRDLLRASARQEFEQARHERDPEVIAKLLVTGRDAVEAAVDKLVDKHKAAMARDRASGERGE
ncbi:uncharacterized protein LOC9643738 [Selaginella moellendorffii]|nr:uncharacterized protein LOC9643738 [Selaginella moellendorffii]|eukprot:XP_002963529.2 uncharacterized protein LOC9643738 [Selaginella moellendorffii]